MWAFGRDFCFFGAREEVSEVKIKITSTASGELAVDIDEVR